MEDQAFRAIGSALSGITSHTATATFTTGGGFSYTPDQMRQIITRLIKLAQGYAKSQSDARYLVLVDGPGLEDASQSHASVASSSGQAYLQSLENENQACLALAQKFQNTLDDYLGLEHHNVLRLNQSGPQDGI